MELGQRYKHDTNQAIVPEEIVVEILKRLPTKSLLRFKTVSRSWYCLITSPSFISTHSDFINHPHRRRLLVVRDKGMDQFIHSLLSHDGHVTKPTWPTSSLTKLLDDPHHQYYYRCTSIHLPVNGIYTFKLGLKESILNTLAFAMWNMSTRDIHILPHIPYPKYKFKYRDTEWTRSNQTYGFGFDSSVSDYKVVVICIYATISDDLLVSCSRIYSLSTNKWKHFRDPTAISLTIPWSAGFRWDHEDVPPICTDLPVYGYYLNNACHWTYTYYSSLRTCRCIVCFDFKYQVVRIFAMPHALFIKRSHYTLTSVGGCLALVCSAETTSSLGYPRLLSKFHKFELWRMGEYGVDSSWSKLYNISLPGSNTIFLGVVDSKIYARDGKTKHISCYGAEDDDDEGCHEYDCSIPKADCVDIIPYSESLVPVKPTSTTLQFV